MIRKSRLLAAAFYATVTASQFVMTTAAFAQPPAPLTTTVDAGQVRYGTINIDGLNIAYREAGDPSLPKLVLLHGWPSSSHQFRNLMPLLAQHFHVIAPDYQGFGNSDHPDPASYHYSFDAISVTVEKFLAAKGFDHYGLFVQDYGGPVGFRIVSRNPKALDWLVIQNSNAYEVGFTPAWDGFRKALWINRTAENEKPLAGFNTPEAIKNIVYLGGAGHPELIFWGEHDPFFSPEGGEAFLQDLPTAEMHRLNAGHFATEDNLPYIANHIVSFYDAQVKPKK